MNRERLQRIRNFQSMDWYPAIVIRPITILVMLVMADWKFLTPNRLTTIATLVKLVAVWLILQPQHWIAACVMLQLGILFDHLDGTVARYRRTFTKLGSFYDKVSDQLTWAVIVLAVGWEETALTAKPMYLLFAAASVIALNARGYMKWLLQAETERIRWLEAKKDPAVIAKYTAPIVIKPPPQRTPSEWLKWFGLRWLAILEFEEMDLWFWLGLALVIRRLDLVLWLMMVTQVAGMAFRVITRTLETARADRRLRELEAAA